MDPLLAPDDEATTGSSQNPVDDLSGVHTSAYSNPYDALLDKANDTPDPNHFIQEAYETYRTTRNADKKAEMISPVFKGIVIDEFLSNRLRSPEYVDPRNSLVFWARPSKKVVLLATKIQSLIKKIMPSIWLMPPENMHTTVLEVVHSVPMEEVMELANKLAGRIDELTTLPRTRYGCRLVKPMVSFDAAAIALSFVPCGPPSTPPISQDPEYKSGSRAPSQTPSLNTTVRPSTSPTTGPQTPSTSTTIPPNQAPPMASQLTYKLRDRHMNTPADPASLQVTLLKVDDSTLLPREATTYHHLRRELYQRIADAGVPIASRYVVPSAHMTLARYVTHDAGGAASGSHELEPENIRLLVETIEKINRELEHGVFWEADARGLVEEMEDEGVKEAGKEVVWDLNKDLVCRVGDLWYGGGFTIKTPANGMVGYAKGTDGVWREC